MNMTEEDAVVRPLLPSLSFLDILLPPLLILLSLILHTIYNDPIPRNLRAHIFRAKTAHARFLPAQARHIFSYPVLFFGVDLDELENGGLDMGRLFSYLPKRWCLTALRPNGYLDPSVDAPDKRVKEKLLGHLATHGVSKEKAQRIYTVTMPAYLGLEGINPLTTHFCYSESEARKLEAVVLEVHNTFGERHLYVLQCGVDEDKMVAVGFKHQWTFPRSFHVSPFNDRTGFYRVSLSDPLRTTSPTSAFPTSPYLNIRIIFLTPEHEKKIYASLAGIGHPLTAGSLLSSLLRWPFSLLLTTPRILYQAMKLHYSKRLDVFPRPEPFVKSGSIEAVNPVEKDGKEGGVGWQEPASVDLYAKEKVVAFLQRRVTNLEADEKRQVKVEFLPADKNASSTSISSTSPSATPDLPVELLQITYLTPLIFSDLLASPTIPLALELGSHSEKRWSTSNDGLFLELFATPGAASPKNLFTRLTRRLRQSQLEWGLSFHHETSPATTTTPPHPLDDGSFQLLWTLAMHFFVIRLGYWIFVATGARFVAGTETWGEHARWAKAQGGGMGAEEVAGLKYGSVLRPP